MNEENKFRLFEQKYHFEPRLSSFRICSQWYQEMMMLSGELISKFPDFVDMVLSLQESRSHT